MRGHQRCGLEREWGIVYTDEVLGEMSSYKDPMAMAPERRKPFYRHGAPPEPGVESVRSRREFYRSPIRSIDGRDREIAPTGRGLLSHGDFYRACYSRA